MLPTVEYERNDYSKKKKNKLMQKNYSKWGK